MKKLKNDPENYRKMSQPHENEEAAKKALDGFYEQVSEARKKFGIADVLIVVKDSIMHDDGREGVFFHNAQYGAQVNGVAMAAYAYGTLKAEERETISKMLSGKV